jgi:dTDP-4-amino-4,6-dideoxygalactose transaminase
MIPMIDLKAQYAAIQDEVEAAVLDVLRSGWYVMGPQHEALEQEAAAYVGVGHALGVASGTDAVHLALRAVGVEPGDEVVTTAFTFVGTVEAILYIGAKPVYADIDPVTFNIDPASIEAVITPRTKAILPVHLFGLPADMDAIMDIADRHGLVVVEDAAQSIGARWRETMTGGIGLAGAFSFYPTKNLSAAGDAGLITTSSDEVAERVRSLRNHGSRKRYYHSEVGYNSRLDEVQAAILRIKLRHVDAYNDARQRHARLYTECLADADVQTPAEPPHGSHAFHQYTILTQDREAVMARLKDAGASSGIYYPIPLHRQEFCVDEYRDVSLPVTERVAEACLSLPMHPELTEEQVRRIAGAVIGG